MKKETIFLLLVLFVTALHAQYGNYRYTNFGTKSILLTGNVTGSVEDLGLTYYNPARLALVESNGLSINAQAYEYQTVILKDAIGQESTLSDARFNSLPSMAAGTFSLFGTRFAYSYFRTNAPTANLSYRSGLQDFDIIPSEPGAESFTFDLQFDTRTRSQLFGLAWAMDVSENLSLGVSLFGTYYSTASSMNMEYVIQPQDGGLVFSQDRQGVRLNSYGLLTKIGLSYSLPGVDLGLNVNLPYVQVFGNGRFDYNHILAGLSPDQDLSNDYRYRKLQARQRSPVGLSAGAGIPLGKHTLHLNMDYVFPLSTYSRMDFPRLDLGGAGPSEVTWMERRQAVFNFGIAAEVFVDDRVVLYYGLSTDKNAMAADSNFLKVDGQEVFRADTGEDFLHAGLGTGLKFDWGNLTLGTTFSSSVSNRPNPFRTQSESIDDAGNDQTSIVTNRWQFIVGLDIPFLDNKVNDLLDRN